MLSLRYQLNEHSSQPTIFSPKRSEASSELYCKEEQAPKEALQEDNDDDEEVELLSLSESLKFR